MNVKRLSEVEEFIFEKVPPFIIHSIADCSSQLKRLTCYCVTSVFTEPEIWYVFISYFFQIILAMCVLLKYNFKEHYYIV